MNMIASNAKKNNNNRHKQNRNAQATARTIRENVDSAVTTEWDETHSKSEYNSLVTVLNILVHWVQLTKPEHKMWVLKIINFSYATRHTYYREYFFILLSAFAHLLHPFLFFLFSFHSILLFFWLFYVAIIFNFSLILKREKEKLKHQN